MGKPIILNVTISLIDLPGCEMNTHKSKDLEHPSLLLDGNRAPQQTQGENELFSRNRCELCFTKGIPQLNV